MNVQDYFDRVGYDGRPAVTTAALFRLHQCHALSVPFENIDVQLGRPLTLDPEAAFDKIVDRRGGGWCYEQNGVFGAVLDALGFEVTRVAAAVMREAEGEKSLDNHLCLLVRDPDDAGTVWLADVGFGGSLLRPLRFEPGDELQVPYEVGLRRLDDGWWRFRENDGSGEFSFDFVPERADEAAMERRCKYLQTDPDSVFVRKLLVQRRLPGRHLALRGRLLQEQTATSRESRLLASSHELATVLDVYFNRQVTATEREALWARNAE